MLDYPPNKGTSLSVPCSTYLQTAKGHSAINLKIKIAHRGQGGKLNMALFSAVSPTPTAPGSHPSSKRVRDPKGEESCTARCQGNQTESQMSWR